MQSITMRAAPAMSGVKLSTTAPRRATTTTPAHAARRTSVHALAAAIDQLTFDGAKSGSSTLELKTARAEVAKGLVHKYVVMVRQNARRVRARAIAYARIDDDDDDDECVTSKPRKAPGGRRWARTIDRAAMTGDDGRER